MLLALENNFDVAIARINLDIADTDILRAKAGAGLRGVSTGLVTGTQGGSGTTVTGGGGPGGTSGGVGGSGAGANGLVLSTSGGGPQPETLDRNVDRDDRVERVTTQQTSPFAPSSTSDTFTGNLAYQQGFLTGTQLSVTFNNTRQTTNSPFSTYSPLLDTTLRAQVTQHLLQGFGWGTNGRFIVQAKNDRRITDSAFRQQLLYTINQVENIYWGLVSVYEDEQAKERALAQSTQLTEDNRKQLAIGTLAPLDVVNSDAAVATDRQALVASQSNAFLGEYEEFKTFFHGHSYTANQLGAAAALASLEILQGNQSIRARQILEKNLRDELQTLWSLPNVGDIRQVGLIAGIELVRDWRTREPLDLRERAGIRVCEAMARRGVLTRPVGNVIVLMPPYCTTPVQARKMVRAVFDSIREVFGRRFL